MKLQKVQFIFIGSVVHSPSCKTSAFRHWVENSEIIADQKKNTWRNPSAELPQLLWFPPATCWMLLGRKITSVSSLSAWQSSDQQLKSWSSTHRNNTPMILYITLLSLHHPWQYFIDFYYLSKSTFLSIIKILNQILITTVSGHQVSDFQTICAVEQRRHHHSRNCSDGFELLPGTSPPPINTAQLRDHATISTVPQSWICLL